MANGTVVVGPQGVQRIDPRLLEMQSRGMSAQGELQDLQRGAAMANALRMSQAQMPGVQGRGASAEAPSGWNALATVLERRKGQNQLNAMQEQARALRGEVAEGQRAGLERQDALSQREFDYRMSQEAARTAREEQARKERFAHEIELEKLRQKGRLSKAKEKANQSPYSKLSGKQQSEVEDMGSMLRTAQNILGGFKEGYGADKVKIMGKEVDAPGLTRFKNWAAGSMPMLTDEDEEARAAWWRGYKKFFELPEVKEGFGSQFTRSEMKRWDAANIHPDMDDKTIQDAINTRLEIMEAAANRKKKSMKMLYKDDATQNFLDYNLSFEPSDRKGKSSEKPKSADEVIAEEVLPTEQVKYQKAKDRDKELADRQAEIMRILQSQQSVSAPSSMSSGGM